MSQDKAQGSPIVLDFQAIGRVIESVRVADASLGEIYNIPANRSPADWERVRTARNELSDAISWAYSHRDLHPDWTSNSRARRRYEALGRARRLSTELLALINDADLPLSSSIAARFASMDEHGFHVVDFSQLMVGLERLKEATENERTRLKNAGLHDAAPLAQVEPSSFATPGNSFISSMGKAFETGFGQAPSIKFTSEREPTGPFVYFVEAVTGEMGEAMTRDGIRKAWDRAIRDRTNVPEKMMLVP